MVAPTAEQNLTTLVNVTLPTPPVIAPAPAPAPAPIQHVPVIEHIPVIQHIPVIEHVPVIQQVPVIEHAAPAQPHRVLPNIPPIYQGLREILLVHEAADRHQGFIENAPPPAAHETSRNRQQIASMIDAHLDAQPRGIIIDPILVGYFYRNHDFGQMYPMDIIRLCLLGLEINRIRIEQMRFQMEQRQRHNDRARCSICFDIFGPGMVILGTPCGHIFCRQCYQRVVDAQYGPSNCSVCRHPITIGEAIRLYIRFNYDGNLICRRCMIEFNPETNMFCFMCGDVFCDACLEAQHRHEAEGCFGCGSAELAELQLHPSF